MAASSWPITAVLRATYQSGTNPSSANAMAGWSTSRSSMVPHRSRARASPATEPGTATERGKDVGVVHHETPRKNRRGGAFHQLVAAVVGRGGRLHVEVDAERLPAPGQVHEHGPAACQRGHERLDHGHGEGGGHRSVDGIAALLEDAGADLRAQGMLRHDHAASGEGRALRCDERGADHAASLATSDGQPQQLRGCRRARPKRVRGDGYWSSCLSQAGRSRIMLTTAVSSM